MVSSGEGTSSVAASSEAQPSSEGTDPSSVQGSDETGETESSEEVLDPWEKSVLVHHLREGKLELDEIYNFYPEDELNDLDDEDKAEIKTDIKLSIFDDLTVNVEEIFYDIED